MFLKNIFDRTVAFVGLLCLWGVLAVVAVMIKVKMPGPVLFTQKRVGRGGKVFNCHKFRTMTVNHGGSTVSVAGESRITPFGAMLRKYKIDELPGLWDVLIGRMSFVGPRPDVPGYADTLQGEDREVLKLRPGITGPASLKYRNEEELIAAFIQRAKTAPKDVETQFGVDFSQMSDSQIAQWYNDKVIYPDKVRINLYYLHNYSFLMDIRMIFATVLGRHITYNGERI